MKANEFRKCPAMALQRLDDATVPRLGAAGPNGVALPLAVLAVAFLGFAGLVLAFARLSHDLRWKLSYGLQS